MSVRQYKLAYEAFGITKTSPEGIAAMGAQLREVLQPIGVELLGAWPNPDYFKINYFMRIKNTGENYYFPVAEGVERISTEGLERLERRCRMLISGDVAP